MSRSTRITILSKSQDIKKHGSVEFSMKGKGAIDEFTISSQSVQIGFFNGQTNSIEITKQEGQSIIARIISSLDSKEINTGTEYNAREFMTKYLPGFSKILSSPPRGNKGISNKNNQPISESKSTVGTTTLLAQETSSTETVPTTEITSNEGASTVGETTPLPTKAVTKPTVGKTSFNFEASTQSQGSTTQGIDHTMQEIRESSKYVYPIAPTPLMRQIISDGAFDVKNGTATWINRQTNKTMGERPTLSGIEPTAVSVEESTAGMSTVAIASLATLGGLGFFIAAGAVAYCLWHREKRTTGYSVSDLPSSPEKQSFLLEGGKTAKETVPKELDVKGSRPRSLSQGSAPLHPKPSKVKDPQNPKRSLSEGGVSGQPESGFELVIISGQERNIDKPPKVLIKI